jgi:hypothetical protein
MPGLYLGVKVSRWEAKHNLRVLFERPPKKEGFAVCVKGLEPQLASPRHIPPSSRVDRTFLTFLMQSFDTTRRRTTAHASGPTSQRSQLASLLHSQPCKDRAAWNGRFNELIPYNDCFYQNIYKYNHITLQSLTLTRSLLQLVPFFNHFIQFFNLNFKKADCQPTQDPIEIEIDFIFDRLPPR